MIGQQNSAYCFILSELMIIIIHHDADGTKSRKHANMNKKVKNPANIYVQY